MPKALKVVLAGAEHVDTREVAGMACVAPGTVEAWRKRRVGPPYYRVGPKKVIYKRTEVLAWIEAGRGRAVAP